MCALSRRMFQMFHVYYIIFILVFHCVLLSSVAEMAALWTAALMLVVMVVLRTLADDSAHSTVGRPTQSPSETYAETSTTDYTGYVTSDGHNTNVAFIGNSGNDNKLVKLFRAALRKLDPLKTDTGKNTATNARTNQGNRVNGWFVRPRIFRSNLSKRSIRTSSDSTGPTRVTQ